MGFWKALFGSEEPTEGQEPRTQEDKQFDLFKYDGVKAVKMRQWEYAVKCFDEALKLRDDLEIHDHLATALLQLGQYDESLRHLQLLADAEPQNVAILLQMSLVAYMKEDYVGMADFCQQAIAAGGENADAYYQMARAYSGQKNAVGAVAMLTKAIALRDDFADARLLRAQTLLDMGDHAGAEEDAGRLLTDYPQQEDVLLLRARLSHAEGKADEAIAYYGRVIEANPFSLDAFRERGKVYFEQGRSREAEADMRQVLELDPEQLDGVSGDYSAEGVEQYVRQAYANANPLGI